MPRKIELKSWKPELDPSVPEGVNAFFRSYLYFARRRIFNRHTLWVGLAGSAFATFLFSSERRREALVFLLSMGVFSLYLYLHAAKIAAALRIHWIKTGEGAASLGDSTTVQVRIENTSAFTASELWIGDTFPAGTARKVRLRIPGKLPAFGALTASYKRRLDAGMGEYDLGPIKLVVGDPLGLFEFIITDDKTRKLNVFPRAEAVEGIAIRGSHDSFQFGVHDVPVHGSSVCFMGVREYARGDSLRQIAWRLSARSSRLLVKDFEKAVNADVTLLLNMCGREHMGNRAHSTWEIAKEAALGVLRQQVAEGNSVQLLSNDVVIPFGLGSEHVEYVTGQIFRATPTLREPHESSVLIDKLSPLIPSSSTLIYVAPFFGKDTHRVVDRLIGLRERNIEIICLALDAVTFMQGDIYGNLRQYLAPELARSAKVSAAESERLVAAGIRVYWLECGRSIAASLLAPPAQSHVGT